MGPPYGKSGIGAGIGAGIGGCGTGLGGCIRGGNGERPLLTFNGGT